LRFASATVSTQLKDALGAVSSNVTLLYLSETKETENDVTVVRDQDGQQRDYVDVLSVKIKWLKPKYNLLFSTQRLP
jgi:hypothetical protein